MMARQSVCASPCWMALLTVFTHACWCCCFASLSGLLVCLVCGVRLVVTSVLVCGALAFDRERCLRTLVVRFARLLVRVVNGEKSVAH